MIRPTKYLDLRTSVINVSTVIIEALLQSRRVTLTELDETVQIQVGPDARVNFLPALSLLFLLGKVDYDLSIDVVTLRTKP